jgi:hypothetical protein
MPSTPDQLPRLIGIAGFARVGKDTAAQALAERWGYATSGTSACLVDMARRMAPDNVAGPIHDYGLEEAKNRYPEVREWLVRFGLACREVFVEGEDFVVLQAIKRAMADGPTVISGLRFKREADLLREQDPTAVVFRVDRFGYTANSDFEREVEDIDVDFVVHNDSDVFSFQFSVCEALVDHCMFGPSRLTEDPEAEMAEWRQLLLPLS